MSSLILEIKGLNLKALKINCNTVIDDINLIIFQIYIYIYIYIQVNYCDILYSCSCQHLHTFRL